MSLNLHLMRPRHPDTGLTQHPAVGRMPQPPLPKNTRDGYIPPRIGIDDQNRKHNFWMRIIGTVFVGSVFLFVLGNLFNWIGWL